MLTLALLAAPAAADGRERSATRDGMTLTVSPAVELDPAGQKVRVRGSGYDTGKGIYVAFCVDNGPGRQPTPCGGGQDRNGTSGNSVWVSSFPPYYGTGLAQPYGEGGSFDVEISVAAQLNEEVDCRTARCAVVTRTDHTRSDDRSMDVVVPVSFARAPASGPAPARAPEPAPEPVSTGSTPGDAPAADGPATAAPPGTAAPGPAAATVAAPTPTAAAEPTAAQAADEPSAAAGAGGSGGAEVTAAAASDGEGDDGGTGAQPAAAGLLALTGLGLAAGYRRWARRSGR